MWRRPRCRPRKMLKHQVRSLGNISRRKSSGNEEDTFFELCCAGPNRCKSYKDAAHTPGSFSRPEFLTKGAQPQTVKQCALHAVAASLVRFDLPFDYSVCCLDDVSGTLQVDAGALPCVGQRDDFHETERLHAVSESFIASASVAETDRLHTVSENLVASAVVPESDRLLAVWESLAVQACRVVTLLGEV